MQNTQENLILDTDFDPSYNNGKGFEIVQRNNSETKNVDLCAEFRLAAPLIEKVDGQVVATHRTAVLSEIELKTRIRSRMSSNRNANVPTPHFEIGVLRELQAVKKSRTPAPA